MKSQTMQIYFPLKEENVRARQIDPIEIFDEGQRIFKVWLTVERVDKDGEILPVEEFKKIMHVLAKRGGFVIYGHSNKVVGKMLNYEFKEKDNRPAVLVTGQVFDDYKIDELVWDKIKNGEISGASFGGAALGKPEIVYEDGVNAKELSDLEGYEISLVESPANPDAVMEEVNYLAKGSADLTKEDFAKIDAVVDLVQKQNNPWAVCTAALGEQHTPRWERCVRHVKEQMEIKSNNENSSVKKRDPDTLSNNFEKSGDVMTNENDASKGEVKKPDNDPMAYLALLPEIKTLLVELNEKLSASTDKVTNDNLDEEPSDETKGSKKKTNPKDEMKTADDTEGEKEPDPEVPQDTETPVNKAELIVEVKKQVLEEIRKSAKVSTTKRPEISDVAKKARDEAQKGNLALDIAKGSKKMSWGELYHIQKVEKEKALEEALN